VEELDELLGGLPVPGLIDVHGPAGQGATRLAATVIAACTRQGRLAAWIDVDRQLYPPALVDLGVDLTRLLIVRPPAGHEVWAGEQVLRSGCFPVVAVSGAERAGRAGQRWAHAAEVGRCTGLILGRHPDRTLPADVRLVADHRGWTVVRDRAGAFGKTTEAPLYPAPADPWQWRRAS
jgi:hypothetical protein